MKLAYPKALFGRDIADGRAMLRSVFRLTPNGGRAVSGVEYSGVSDVPFPPHASGSSVAPPSAATCGASSGMASWTAPPSSASSFGPCGSC
eukprot:14343771-Alexandrium_andersonii.AAC.1